MDRLRSLYEAFNSVAAGDSDAWDRFLEEFYDPEIEKRQRGIAHARGFELQDHSLALYAACTKKDCPYKHRT